MSEAAQRRPVASPNDTVGARKASDAEAHFPPSEQQTQSSMQQMERRIQASMQQQIEERTQALIQRMWRIEERAQATEYRMLQEVKEQIEQLRASIEDQMQ
eukprot:GHVU01070119.1.p2 GENE.GHVU01070119.1~~GHVU01070119.1.p2  ORF type:complete len:101 (+),score=23.58 GHVU01070119.1:494-796(+)